MLFYEIQNDIAWLHTGILWTLLLHELFIAEVGAATEALLALRG